MTTMIPMNERRLDLREFQDIVDEARRLIPRYCPEWTDHNVSDPGITLIELFAWMTEMILYQINRVPDEMYEKFLELIGVQRRPPEPALADVTFFLSGAINRPVVIPPDTEVATDRTEFQEAIIFSTVEPLVIAPVTLKGLRAWREGQGFEDYLPYVTSGLVQAPIFNDEPVEGDALYIGYEKDLRGASLVIGLDCQELEGVHVDPRDPPLAWEYYSSARRAWAPLRLLDQSGTGRLREPGAIDPTLGLNHPGEIYVHVPTDSTPQVIDGIEATWLRVRYLEKEGQGYTTSPRVTGISTACIGGTVQARQAQLIQDEFLGRSEGVPGQTFTLSVTPVIRETKPHVIEAELDGEVTEWVEVEDFAESGETDKHFMIHYPTAQVRFGPAVRARDGTQRQYGAVPRKGANLVLKGYRSGGGTGGNIGQGTITQLKSSVPFIGSLTNYEPSRGGLNEETLDEAKLRALAVLKHPVTAVTREDYERLALEVEGVGRARCLAAGQDGSTSPGTIRLLLVPGLGNMEEELTPEMLMPTPELIQAVAAQLEARKTLGTVVELQPAPLAWAEIDAHIYVTRSTDPARAQDIAVRRLRALLHPSPANGGSANFGAAITVSQIAGVLQSLPGVVYIERVRLRRQGDPSELTRLQPPPDTLLVLGHCYVLAEVIED
ncbi:MAG TPA: putative baseplate assembly protein [Dehalococcoidia bacterium]|nr:putative baseplate assembly protein [Dehalococcoidia bacterium]